MEDDTLVETAGAPTDAELTMIAVDDALKPALYALSRTAGPVHASQLVQVISCVRAAISHAIYGPPEEVEHGGESLDMLGQQRKAQADAQVGQAQPVFVDPVAEATEEQREEVQAAQGGNITVETSRSEATDVGDEYTGATTSAG